MEDIYVGRAYINQLKDADKKKEFSAEIKRKDSFPSVSSLKCKCDRHKAGCGCLTDTFLTSDRVNHFCCLQQCEDSQEHACQMRALGVHHCRDIHEWDESESCGFHENKSLFLHKM